MFGSVITALAARRSPSHWFLGGAVASLAAAAALGEGAQIVAGSAVSLASLSLAVVGIRARRPAAVSAWWALTGGALAFLIGTGVASAYGGQGAGRVPVRSPADVFFVVGYALLITGGTVLVRHRWVECEDDGILDAVIAAAAVGVVAVAYVAYPYLRNPGLGLVEKSLTVAYQLADVVLVAITVRIALPERRPTSYYLVAASLVAVIATDALTTLRDLGTVPGVWVAAAAPLGHVLFGAAAVDPSMARLTDHPEIRNLGALSVRRLVLMFVALLLVPGLLAAHVLFGDQMAALPVLAAGSVLIALLVMARLVDLVRAKERVAVRERVLRHAGACLVAATSREELYKAAMEGLSMLTGDSGPARASLAVNRSGALAVVASVGHRSEEAVGAVVPLDRLPDGGFGACRRPLALAGATPIDLADGDGERADVLAVPLSSHGELSGAFVVSVPGRLPVQVALAIEDLAGQVSLALESAELTEEIHQRRHERRFKVLVEHAFDLIIVLGRHGLLTFVSPASAGLLGRPPATLVGRPGLGLVHPGDLRRIAGVRRAARASGGAPEAMELRVLHADGRWRWFEVGVTDAFGEPEVDGLVIHARDVTDRRTAERRVAESEARFRSLVQNATDLVMVVDEDWALAYVSPSVTRLLGRLAADVLGTPWLGLVEREDVATAARLVATTAREAPSRVELRARGADGSQVHLEVTVSDLRHDPAVAGLVMNARDVTERRNSEERWRAFGVQASHQLRTPITGLRLSLENLLGAPSAPRAALEGALAHVERLESTVEDFLTLAPRRLAPARQLDVGAVLADVDAAWRGLVEAAGRRLQVTVRPPLPVVCASAAAMRQVLGVLVENAIQHGEGPIGVSARELAGGLAFEVTDMGSGLVAPPGLSPPRRDRSGIGLALARSLAEAEGGRLVVRHAGPSPGLAVVLPGCPPPGGEATGYGLGVEAVAGAAYGGDPGRAGPAGQLVPQRGDVHVKRLGGTGQVNAPDLLHDAVAAEGLARLRRQQHQQVELLGPQPDLPAAPGEHPAGAGVDPDIAGHHRGAVDPGPGTAQLGPETGQELSQAKGLHHVVVGARVETDDHVDLLGAGGQDQDQQGGEGLA